MQPTVTLMELVRQAQAHNKAALETLLAQVRDRMKGYFHDRAGPIESSDLSQDILVKVARYLIDFEGKDEAQFWAWVTTMAQTRWVDEIRRRNRLKRAAIEVPLPVGSSGAARLPDGGESPSEIAQRREHADQTRAALAALSSDEQTVIKMRYFDDRPWEEVAATLARSVEATKKFYQRSIKRLRKACEEM